MQKIWFESPAQEWSEALPIGNGSLGGMLYGGNQCETIALNADTFWAGYPHDKTENIQNDWLEKVRELLCKEEYSEAESLTHQYMQGEEVDGYQPVGSLLIDYQLPVAGDYGRRVLDLENGLHQTTFTAMGRNYLTEAFVSFHHDVIAVRVTCDKPAYFTVKLEGHYVKEVETRDNILVLRGQAPEVSNQLAYYYKERKLHEQGTRGVWYESAAAASCDGNICAACGELRFENVTELFLCLAVETGYAGMECPPTQNFREKAAKTAARGLQLGYDCLKREQVRWFSTHMQKLNLELNETENSLLPTDKRLENFCKGADDPAFAALYMQFGRYLLLSSSAKGMPANLQGIWNREEKAPWNSNYTLNINLPMNYWLAEIGNLSFCHRPLFEFLRQAKENGKKSAKAYFGCRGFFLAHNSDLWGSAVPVNGYPRCIAWTTGGAWLCRHIWEHWLYTEDIDFLKEYLPVIADSVRFSLDYMTKDKEGRLSYFPSSSPENEYLWKGEKVGVAKESVMELSIVRELLEIYLQACKKISASDPELEREAECALHSLRLPVIGSDGRLLEWGQEFEEAEQGHRHLSHLYGIYPAWEWETAPDYQRAAKASLDARMEHGSGHTGWSAAWAACLYARFGEGDAAYGCLQKLWKNSTFSNLFDTCNDVFQIDGNLGAPAGILEMLVQSHRGRIELLPALPKVWQDGAVRGICLRGGGELEMEWQDGKLREYHIHGTVRLPIYYQGEKLA